MSDDFEKIERVSPGVSFLILGVTFMVDMFQILVTLLALIPFVGTFFVGVNFVIGLFLFICLEFFFVLHGVHTFKRPKLFVGRIAGSCLEMIMGILPMWTITTYLTLRTVREEDRTHNHAAAAHIQEQWREEQEMKAMALYASTAAAQRSAEPAPTGGYASNKQQLAKTA